MASSTRRKAAKKRSATRKPAAAKKGAATRKRTAKTRPVRKTVAKKTRAKKAPGRRAAKSAATKRTARKGVARKRRPGTAGRPGITVKTKRRAAREAAAPRRKATARRLSAPPVIDVSLFPCGDEAIRAATGKDWNEWLALLDAAGAAARRLDHQRIWELAMQSLPDSAGWWGQMVSVGYERARGLREKHETSAGDFQATLSRTLRVPLFAAFAAWADEGLRGNWLDAPGLQFTKLNAGRNIRARWPDGTRLDIRFTDNGPDKCQIVVDTMKLPDAASVQKAKAFWQEQFERLQAYLRA